MCKNRKKVAVVYHFFPHYRSAIMTELLASTEFDYYLVGDKQDPDESIKHWDYTGPKLILTPWVRLFGRIIWQKGLLSISLKPDFDVIIFLANANWISTWIAAILARIAGKRVLFWTHGWVRRDPFPKGILRKAFYKIAHCLLLYGYWARSIALTHDFLPRDLYVIYNSLDYKSQCALRNSTSITELLDIRKELGLDTQIPLVIFCGRLTATCQLDILIDAMAVLKTSGINGRLLIIGDGPMKEMLSHKADELSVPIIFYGECYDEHILSKLMMTSNIMVSPGKVGLMAMHGLAYGTPIITHGTPEKQMPEFEAIIPGKTGDFFRFGDHENLAEVMRKWMCMDWLDHSRRQACYELIDRYYNPQFQAKIIDRAVKGIPAEDPDISYLNTMPWYYKGKD